MPETSQPGPAMIDHRHIGYVSPPFSTEVERGRLKFFAKARTPDNLAHINQVLLEMAKPNVCEHEKVNVIKVWPEYIFDNLNTLKTTAYKAIVPKWEWVSVWNMIKNPVAIACHAHRNV